MSRTNAFAVEEGVFGRRLVAGAFVFSLGLGLAATNCLNSFSYGYDRLRFIKPVFIGDTIYTIRENLSKVVHNDTMGKLRVSYSVYKGEGELVLYAEHLLTALYRDPAPFAGRSARRDRPQRRPPMVNLRGMTWDHARGFDPMVATSAAYAAAHPGVTITWEKRSLAGLCRPADFARWRKPMT